MEDHFYLPIHIETNKILEYKFETLEYTEEEMATLLQEKFMQFCTNLEKQNIIILENKLIIKQNKEGAQANSLLMLQEEAVIHRKIIDF